MNIPDYIFWPLLLGWVIWLVPVSLTYNDNVCNGNKDSTRWARYTLFVLLFGWIWPLAIFPYAIIRHMFIPLVKEAKLGEIIVSKKIEKGSGQLSLPED